MSLYKKLRGTTETIFALGIGGPQLKNNAGVLEARDPVDGAYVPIRSFNGTYPALLGRSLDVNSQLVGSVFHPSWQSIGSAPGTLELSDGTDANGVTLDAVGVNKDLVSPGVGTLARYWWCPSGTTVGSIVVSVLIKLPAGASGNAAIYLQLMNQSQSVVLQQVLAVPTGSWAALTLPSQAVTAGVGYWIRVLTSGNGQQAVDLGRITVTPGDTTDQFWTNPYVRYQIDAADLADNCSLPGSGLAAGYAAIGSYYAYADPDSSFSFWTTATTIMVEADVTHTLGQQGAIVVLQNGVKVALLKGPNRVPDIFPVTGLSPGLKRITLQTGSQSLNGAGHAFTIGGFLNAVYVPQADSFSPEQPPSTTDGVVIYGNSKLMGYSTLSNPVIADLSDILRATRQSGRVLQKAIGSRSLRWDYLNGGNSLIPLAKEVVSAHPTHILWEALRNDWGGAGGTTLFVGSLWANAAAWAVQFAALLDYVNTCLPACQQWLVYTTHETSEGNNTSGESLANYWTQQDTIFTNRQTGGSTPWTNPPKKMDLRVCWSSGGAATYTFDSLHPNTTGYGVIGATVRSTMGGR